MVRRICFRRSVAQWLEHRSPKPGVAGSSPVAPALPLASLFTAITLAFAGIAVAAYGAEAWVIAVAAAVLALWMAGLAIRMFRAAREEIAR